MEENDRDPAATGYVLGHMQFHQRSLSQVETHVPWIQQGLQLTGNIAVSPLQLMLANPQRRLAPDNLHRLVKAFPGNGGAQDIVAFDHGLQRLDKCIDPGATVHAQCALQQIGVAFRCRKVVIENAFLQRHQCIDILNIGHAPRNARHHGIDLFLAQAGQRQHLRSNALCARLDEVDRHRDIATGTRRFGQPRQGRLTEQDPHIDLQPCITHTLDQFDGQQRIASQFKELVMTADAFDPEQLAPQVSQNRFHRALRHFVFTSCEG
ncbi:hypothetical protein PSCICN_09330 [Pseudomonas cichorii]|nr:hypothetical protein PSCICN_09330 [Pseudomonas cichorii]